LDLPAPAVEEKKAETHKKARIQKLKKYTL
jgi:hypothetical protein